MYDQIILLGVIVSVLFFEWTGLSPAGLIVPGYFVLSLHSPARIVCTLAIQALASVSGLPFRADVIGILIPGIIARDFDRQGVIKSLLSLAVVTALLALLLTLFGYPVL